MNNNPKYFLKICLIILFSSLFFIIIWQILFIIRIPDVDTDAYVHHSIARQIIISPKDLSIHWVWLPLFHYISSGVILLGGNLETIRFINIFIWSSVPIIIFFYLYNRKNEYNLFIAFVASIVCVFFPIGILMGTTAQPEPLFALLVLLFVISSEKNKYILASIILAFACILRYEAWAILFITFILYLTETIKNKKIFNRKLYNVLLPSSFILIWAVLRLPFDGKFFGFLFQTQQFVNEALNESNSFQGGLFKIAKDFFHFPIIIPALFMGINLLFVPFGIKKGINNNKWLLLSGLGILVFITLSWILKSNLGLNRHFVVLIPMYSVLAAYGLEEIIIFLKNKSDKSGFLKSINIKYTLLVILFTSCLIYLVMWLVIWDRNHYTGYPEKKLTAEYLRNIPDSKTIFCNDAIVEIFSKIDYRRFNRTWMENNPNASDLIIQTAEKEGCVYIVIPEDKWKNINNIGEILYQSPVQKETNLKLLILKVK